MYRYASWYMICEYFFSLLHALITTVTCLIITIVVFSTWYIAIRVNIWFSPVLDMLLLDTWYLTLDIRHRYLTCYYLTPDTYIWHRHLTCYTWYLISDTGTWYVITWHLILDTWYPTLVLDMFYLTPHTWHLISDTGTWHVITWHRILDTWYLIPVLDMLSLDTDTWHLISDTGTWHVITWYPIPDTWYMALDNWHAITYLTCFHMVLVHLTWYCDTWLDTITPDTCIILHIHDYHFYGNLSWLLYCYQSTNTPVLLCSWTHVFLNPCNRETPDIMLLILYSCWSP